MVVIDMHHNVNDGSSCNINQDSSNLNEHLDVFNHVQAEVMNDDGKEESICSNFFHSPNGTKYWIPNSPEDLKPLVGSKFSNWEDVYVMYQLYAEIAGFDIRLSTTKKKHGVITHKYILCSKSGKPRGQQFDTRNDGSSYGPSRTSSIKVTECPACIRVKFKNGHFIIYDFVEKHNHGLVDCNNQDLTRKRRQLNFSDQEFIHRARIANVGPNVAHKIQTAIKGGQHMVRGTVTDYKNFSRDIRRFIGNRDAQMIIDTLNQRKVNWQNFTFDCKAVKSELRSLFWADDVSKCNYSLFGDILAFDATYHTNQYNMIFVPFTGVDHHKKCVTFGAGLLYDETVDSYKWLLESFIHAHGKQPTLVLTDQDAAMKQAVAAVLNESKHRLCMWHITKKLPKKVSGDVSRNNEIRRAIHKLVWNVFIEPTVFEERWRLLMGEYNLEHHEWLCDMFAIRQQWVPAYFKDIPMCCLMKTTSRCESSNALFKLNSSGSNTLVDFLLCFDSTIEGQRYQQRLLEHGTSTSKPSLRTRLQIEKHASCVYTRNIFDEVQKEIVKAVWFCSVSTCEVVGNSKIYIVAHNKEQSGLVGEFKVILNLNDHSATCSCMLFTRIGYLCRHVFCVYKNQNIHEIPNMYLSKRWMRNVLPKSLFNMENRYGLITNEKTRLRHEAFDLFEQCAEHLGGNTDGMQLLIDNLKELNRKIIEDFPYQARRQNKGVVIEELTGHSNEQEVDVNPPQGIRNKGCGTNRRLIGPGEKAITRSQKPKRFCRTCNTYTNDHDSRNCPEKMKAAEENPSV